ncbi:hypothetical protein [Neobacillus drentensis]|uniref:hypothetical protein n=1 Tax=Neobacillus drentensis TaxID=220684 RepID=UPI003002B5EE
MRRLIKFSFLQTMSESAHQLKFNLRRLWMEHAIWTSRYIVSAEANLAEKQMVLARLLRNQDEIGTPNFEVCI